MAWWSSSSASDPSVSTTQARSSSTEFDISASGATSPKLVMRGPDGPAASATACAPNACRWVRRKPDTPAPAAPKANRIPGSAPPAPVRAARMAKVSPAPSGSQAQPLERAAARFCLADPAHDTDVVLPEPVSQDRLGGIDINPLAFQQRPDAGGSGRAEVAQPVLLLGFVGGHDLFRHLVDVEGGDLGDAQPGCADDGCVVGAPPEFLQAPVLESGRADAIGTQQRGNGYTALRQSAGIFLGGRGDAHMVDVDAVLKDVQQRGHVLPDTGFQQREDPAIGTQLRDLPHDQVVNVRGQLCGAEGKRAGDVGGALCHGWTRSVHRRIVRRRLQSCPVTGMAKSSRFAHVDSTRVVQDAEPPAGVVDRPGGTSSPAVTAA